jgi:hypothetical protein
MQQGFGSREAHALDEHTFIQNAESRLDDFIAQGREVLDNLVDQRNILKGTQRRLLDTANTLGLSKDVISWIERRRSVSHEYLGVSFHIILSSQHAGHIYLLWWCRLHFSLFLSDMALPWIARSVHYFVEDINTVSFADYTIMLDVCIDFLLEKEHLHR